MFSQQAPRGARRCAFTLVELLVGLGIIAVRSGIVLRTLSNAGSDHSHVQDFDFSVAPQPHITIGLIAKQMPLGIHGGGTLSWQAMLNYGFLDGHA